MTGRIFWFTFLDKSGIVMVEFPELSVPDLSRTTWSPFPKSLRGATSEWVRLPRSRELNGRRRLVHPIAKNKVGTCRRSTSSSTCVLPFAKKTWNHALVLAIVGIWDVRWLTGNRRRCCRRLIWSSSPTPGSQRPVPQQALCLYSGSVL